MNIFAYHRRQNGDHYPLHSQKLETSSPPTRDKASAKVKISIWAWTSSSLLLWLLVNTDLKLAAIEAQWSEHQPA